MNALMKRFPVMYDWDLDELIQDFFGGTRICRNTGFPKNENEVDEDGNLVMRYALAGYPKENLHVEASPERLVVRADKTDKNIGGFAGRSFQNVYSNPKGHWDFTATDISYKDGMLTLKIPPKEETKTRELKIE